MRFHIINVFNLLAIVDNIIVNNKPFNMCAYQINKMHTRPKFTGLCLSEHHTDEFITCCLAGYIAISNAFIKSGGKPCNETGKPLYKGLGGYRAIAKWLLIDDDLSAIICGVDPGCYRFYSVDSLRHITPSIIKFTLSTLFGVTNEQRNRNTLAYRGTRNCQYGLRLSESAIIGHCKNTRQPNS